MAIMDLFNERSVRLAEATRIRLYLPGLGTGLMPEDDEDIKQGPGSASKGGGSSGPTSALHGVEHACICLHGAHKVKQ